MRPSPTDETNPNHRKEIAQDQQEKTLATPEPSILKDWFLVRSPRTSAWSRSHIMKNHTSPSSPQDIFINHKLTSSTVQKPLTLLDRYHLIRCYLQTAIFGLIANLFIPLIAAAAKLRAEGRSEITNLSVQGWSLDRELCWYVAAVLGLASLLKVFQLAREQFPGFVGFITTLILCCGAEQQWILFKPTWDMGGASFFDLFVTASVFLFVLAANAFAGASNLAIEQRQSELDCLQTLDDNLVTQAALLKIRDDRYRAYFQHLDETLQSWASNNGKSSLKVFRDTNGDVEVHWLGPSGKDLLVKLVDPNDSMVLLSPSPKSSRGPSKSSHPSRVAIPKSHAGPSSGAQKPTGEDEHDPNLAGNGKSRSQKATTIAGTKSGQNRS
jgi:hypothetical protein